VQYIPNPLFFQGRIFLIDAVTSKIRSGKKAERGTIGGPGVYL
jgi:hypothetical protein